MEIPLKPLPREASENRLSPDVVRPGEFTSFRTAPYLPDILEPTPHPPPQIPGGGYPPLFSGNGMGVLRMDSSSMRAVFRGSGKWEEGGYPPLLGVGDPLSYLIVNKVLFLAFHASSASY